MPGPPPKDKSQRRRKNAPARGEWVDLPEVDPKNPALPALPKREVTVDAVGNVIKEWHPRSKATWKAWREDPATTQYGPAEIAAALDLIHLYERMVRGDTKLTNEMRLQRQALGLDSRGKRDLRWRAPSEAPAESEIPSGSNVTSIESARKRVRAV